MILVGRDRCDDSPVQDGVTTRPWIVDDDLWALIEPLLPPRPERAPGPRPAPDRLCLRSILYVLRNDIAWQLLPAELGFGSGQTCWRRLERWQRAGVFDRLHRSRPQSGPEPPLPGVEPFRTASGQVDFVEFRR
ncbi:transposase [Actinospica acidiphila]|nr:transposase [Actinospica acidiphila]